MRNVSILAVCWMFGLLVACTDPPESTCGNGVVENGEDCDLDQVAVFFGYKANCRFHGGRDIRIPCTRDCALDWDFCQRIGTCGDSILQPEYESCDGTDLGDATCESLGHYEGQVSCNESCRLADDGCLRCGDGILQPEYGELCDIHLTCQDFGFAKGNLVCTDCTSPDVSRCEPGAFSGSSPDHHLVTAAQLVFGNTLWRAGFTVGSLPGKTNAHPGCPELFGTLMETEEGFVSDAWDPHLRLNPCQDLFLESLSLNGEKGETLQWGTSGADIPTHVLDTGFGELLVVSWYVEDPATDSLTTLGIMFHFFRPSCGTMSSFVMAQFPVILPDLQRSPVVSAFMQDGKWSLVLDESPDTPVPSFLILSGDVTEPDFFTTQWDPRGLLAGQDLAGMTILNAMSPFSGHHVVHALVTTGENRDGSDLHVVFWLSDNENPFVAWVQELETAMEPRLYFSIADDAPSPSTTETLHALEFSRANPSAPSREWEFTPMLATKNPEQFRMGATMAPLAAQRSQDAWIVAGAGDLTIPLQTYPVCHGCSRTWWQVTVTPGSWSEPGIGWVHTEHPPSTFFRFRAHDGSWIATGSAANETPARRTFLFRLP